MPTTECPLESKIARRERGIWQRLIRDEGDCRRGIAPIDCAGEFPEGVFGEPVTA